jgi:hypothetical protein
VRQDRRRGELIRRVDVAESVGFVVERDFDHHERRVPRVDLAAAGVEKRTQMRQDVAPDEAEHGMRLIERLRDGKRGPGSRGEPLAEARNQIRG